MLNNFKPYLIIILVGCTIIIIFLSYFFIDREEEIFIANEETTTTTIINKNFFVDVKGAVKKPGVYEFKNGNRVIDAINKSGGLTSSGNTSNINLSKKLNSEMVVYVYNNKEIKEGSKSIACNTTCDCETIKVNNCVENLINNKININTASITELQTLSGIGEAKANDIIKYRDEYGQFNNIEELKNISGIGDAIFEKIKEYITV
ncbi:MAG: helix-hairpin-helix domain-containing protein [Bacilli bacterium]|nr:helix-hairpin-helix domain-containing protein [Bacilli bacterium]MDD4407175.1 helix-hairpin-helix domain-containing protein [Bacilli bacterium]